MTERMASRPCRPLRRPLFHHGEEIDMSVKDMKYTTVEDVLKLRQVAIEMESALEEIMRWWDGDDGIEEQFINARQALAKARGEVA